MNYKTNLKHRQDLLDNKHIHDFFLIALYFDVEGERFTVDQEHLLIFDNYIYNITITLDWNDTITATLRTRTMEDPKLEDLEKLLRMKARFDIMIDGLAKQAQAIDKKHLTKISN